MYILERSPIFMKEKYVTITGMNHYYGLTPFKIGKKFKCKKDKHNPYDQDAIKVMKKHIGIVGYIANTPYTSATGTMTASRIQSKVKKEFTVEVMFITSSKVICKVVDGFKEKKGKEELPPIKQIIEKNREDIEGLDLSELEFMGADERTKILQEAGLDPKEFSF